MSPTPRNELRTPRIRPARLAAGIAINLAGIAILTSQLLTFGAG